MQIHAREVRLIDADGGQAGVVSVQDALIRAREAALDLVEIAPNAEPPVCRVMDYGKYLFELKKKRKMQSKAKQVQVKEVKLRPTTDVGDYQVKVRKAIEFLQEGNKVKFTIKFRGREIAYHAMGREMLERLVHDLSQYGTAEGGPNLEGKQMMVVLNPTKK